MPGVKDWLKKASGNLKGARSLCRDEETLDLAAYATQQSAEKAFKAYLVFKQQSIPRTHDLTKLLTECSTHDVAFDQLRKSAATLSPYAMYTRYPDDRFTIDHKEVIEAITHAEKILKFVKAKIEPPAKNQQLDFFIKLLPYQKAFSATPATCIVRYTCSRNHLPRQKIKSQIFCQKLPTSALFDVVLR